MWWIWESVVALEVPGAESCLIVEEKHSSNQLLSTHTHTHSKTKTNTDTRTRHGKQDQLHQGIKFSGGDQEKQRIWEDQHRAGLLHTLSISILTSRFPCCVLLTLSWKTTNENTTNENRSTDKLSRAINYILTHITIQPSESSLGISWPKESWYSGPSTHHMSQATEVFQLKRIISFFPTLQIR